MIVLRIFFIMLLGIVIILMIRDRLWLELILGLLVGVGIPRYLFWKE